VKGSYYYHYIVRHVPEESDNDNIIWSQLQNQDAEAFHSTDMQISESALSKNGTWKKTDYNLQRFMLLLCRVYLAKKNPLLWLGKPSDYNRRVYIRNSMAEFNSYSAGGDNVDIYQLLAGAQLDDEDSSDDDLFESRYHQSSDDEDIMSEMDFERDTFNVNNLLDMMHTDSDNEN
jgi:hypothetical protein